MAADGRDTPPFVRARLKGTAPAGPDALRVGGLSVEESRPYLELLPAARTPAAVLVGLVERPAGLTVLLTERAAGLRQHAGQIAFPGGRIEPDDEGPVAAALRETEEEIGLDRSHVEVLGFLDDQLVISGFRVTPVVALVRPGFTLTPDPEEVAGCFEVPLAVVLDPARYRPRRVVLAGREVEFRELHYESQTIWGMTCGVLVALGALLAAGDGD